MKTPDQKLSSHEANSKNKFTKDTDKIPQNIKNVFLYFVNFILFFVYYYIILIVIGAIEGVILGFFAKNYDTAVEFIDNTKRVFSLIIFILYSAIAIIFRKKIFIKIKK